MTPTFDTTGFVEWQGAQPFGHLNHLSWDDLSPGVQGCIAEMLEEVRGDPEDLRENISAIEYGGNTGTKESAKDALARLEGLLALGFSDLHPDTLARIIADWKLALEDRRLAYYPTATAGRLFWSERQRGFLNGDIPQFPPLTPYLNDEGKVCLRDKA